jgi:hypothetical protein
MFLNPAAAVTPCKASPLICHGESPAHQGAFPVNPTTPIVIGRAYINRNLVSHDAFRFGSFPANPPLRFDQIRGKEIFLRLQEEEPIRNGKSLNRVDQMRAAFAAATTFEPEHFNKGLRGL